MNRTPETLREWLARKLEEAKRNVEALEIVIAFMDSPPGEKSTAQFMAKLDAHDT